MVKKAQLRLKDRWILVTGASSGLGRAMAERLASHEHAHLLLTSRRLGALASVANDLRSSTSGHVEVVAADLTDQDAIDRVAQAARRRKVSVIILNAGVTYYGRHVEQSEAQLLQLLDTNIRGAMLLLHAVLRELGSDGLAAVLIVSSAAGIVPVPYQAAYSGSKAFLINFAQALNEELLRNGISVTVVAPAGIATEMLEKSGLSKKFGRNHPGIMTPERVAALALRGLVRRKPLVLPGLSAKLGSASSRVAPRRALLRLMRRLYEPPSEQARSE